MLFFFHFSTSFTGDSLSELTMISANAPVQTRKKNQTQRGNDLFQELDSTGKIKFGLRWNLKNQLEFLSYSSLIGSSNKVSHISTGLNFLRWVPVNLLKGLLRQRLPMPFLIELDRESEIYQFRQKKSIGGSLISDGNQNLYPNPN
jgi:hypothetical protein